MLTKQSIGAFGEKAVEAELWRHGWTAANVNAHVPNAKDFDIFACHRNGVVIKIRVTARAPSDANLKFLLRGAFLYGKLSAFQPDDYTVLVWAGERREKDTFFIVPSREVAKRVHKYSRMLNSTPTKQGNKRQPLPHASLIMRKNSADRCAFRP